MRQPLADWCAEDSAGVANGDVILVTFRCDACAGGAARHTGPQLDLSRLSDAALAELVQLSERALKEEQR